MQTLYIISVKLTKNLVFWEVTLFKDKALGVGVNTQSNNERKKVSEFMLASELIS